MEFAKFSIYGADEIYVSYLYLSRARNSSMKKLRKETSSEVWIKIWKFSHLRSGQNWFIIPIFLTGAELFDREKKAPTFPQIRIEIFNFYHPWNRQNRFIVSLAYAKLFDGDASIEKGKKKTVQLPPEIRVRICNFPHLRSRTDWNCRSIIAPLSLTQFPSRGS